MTIAASLLSQSAAANAAVHLTTENRAVRVLSKGFTGVGYLGSSLVSLLEGTSSSIGIAFLKLGDLVLSLKYLPTDAKRQWVHGKATTLFWYTAESGMVLKSSLMALYRGIFPKTENGARLVQAYVTRTLPLIREALAALERVKAAEAQSGRSGAVVIVPGLHTAVELHEILKDARLWPLLQATFKSITVTPPPAALRALCSELLKVKDLSEDARALLQQGAGQVPAKPLPSTAKITALLAEISLKAEAEDMWRQPAVRVQLQRVIEGFLETVTLFSRLLEGDIQFITSLSQAYFKLMGYGERLGSWLEAKGLVRPGLWLKNHCTIAPEKQAEIDEVVRLLNTPKEISTSITQTVTQIKTAVANITAGLASGAAATAVRLHELAEQALTPIAAFLDFKPKP